MQSAGNNFDRSGFFTGVEVFYDFIEGCWSEIFVEIVIDLNGGSAGASADTFDFF